MLHRSLTGRTRSALAALIAAATLAACADAPTAAAPRAASAARLDVMPAANIGYGQIAANQRVNITIPTQFAAQNPCAGGRFGEIVVFTGDQHLVFDQTATSNGHVSTMLHWNAEDITGIGQYTGLDYRATGITQDKQVDATLPYSETMTNNYHIIGQGQATNLDLHETVHVTIDANGWVTAWVTDYTFSCKQSPTF